MTNYNAFRDGEPLALALDEVAKLRARIEKLEAALRDIEKIGASDNKRGIVLSAIAHAALKDKP